jgi:hypothetical protein
MLLDLHIPHKDPRDEHKVHQLQVCGLDSCRFVFFKINIVGYINDAYMVVVGGSHRRAPGIAIRSPPRTPEPETESEASVDSEPGYPSYHEAIVIGSSQLAGAPLATQETPPKRRGRWERADVGSQNVVDTQSGRVRKAKKVYTPNP